MTSRLIQVVKHDWASFDGLMASQRDTAPLHLPMDRFLNAVYWWAIRNATEQEEIDRFDRQLWRPPVGVVPAAGSPWSPEAETAAFNSLAAAFGTGAGSSTRTGGAT